MIEQHRPPAVRGYSLIQTGLPVEKMYVYRGDGTDQLQDEYLRIPLEKPRAERSTQEWTHGANMPTNYRRCKIARGKACESCRLAYNEYWREYRAKKARDRK